MTDRIFLTVPFSEKDHAKQLGARWDAQTKCWFIRSEQDTTLFARWLPKQMALPITPVSPQHRSLSQLLQQVQHTISNSFIEAVWVVAEITELHTRQGHYYLTLTQSQEGQQIAQAKATLWATQATSIITAFEKATNSRLQAGLSVLLCVDIQFHPRYGLALNIVNIDPTYTLGDQAAKLNQIRQQLIQQGLYDLNRQQSLPNVWQRVVVLSPAQAAGLGDFQREAAQLSARHLCHFDYVHATFQGQSAVSELIQALTKIQNNHAEYDAIIIIRGGGAKNDLMFLNDFELAKMIATMPIAVMTGIGHERDNTILDEVAHTSLDTPSKVIGYIFEQILVQTQQAKNDWKVIRYMAQQRHAQQQQRITHHMMHIRQDARQHITHHRQNITHANHRLTRHALSIVQQERQRAIHFKQSLTPSALSYATRHRLNINHWHQLVLNMHPHRLLNMGYTLLHNEHDRVITHYQDAIQEKRFRIEFHDGSVWATIERPDL